MATYTTVRELGRGGFGVVEEVIDERNRRFARKTFSPDPFFQTQNRDGLKKRFKREVKTQQSLGGTEIIPVLASALNDPTPWFVMPLADRSYDVQIKEEKASGKITIDPIADIMNGLTFLHDMEYVHRDLNPKNVLLHDGRWKLADFGAVLPPSGGTVTLTDDTVIYTERYCSPEQRQDFHKAQAPADIYSFGCILHDLFGTGRRTPYGRHTAPGPMGAVIEKCTEPNPARRPTIRILRDLVFAAMIEAGGHCKVEDEQAEQWLRRLDDIGSWTEEDFDGFARFFAGLDISERTSGHEFGWVYSLSTPFLTRLPWQALARIVSRHDGVSEAIVEKYCEWVRATAFLFAFADTVCARLVAIFEHGSVSEKAMALVALIHLAETHNRWYVMREMLKCCHHEHISREVGRRLAIEIRTEEMEMPFRRCVEAVQWEVDRLAPHLRQLLN